MTHRFGRNRRRPLRPGHARGDPPPPRQDRGGNAADAAEKLLLADRQGGTRCLREPVHAGRHDPGAGLRHRDPPGHVDPGGRLDHRGFPRRADARGRHLYAQRSLLRRHASARFRRRHAGVRGRPADRARRNHDAPSGRRRQDGRLRANQLDRDLPGGHPHTRRRLGARGRLRRDADGRVAPERAHPRHLHWRPSRAGRRLQDRGCAPARGDTKFGDNTLLSAFRSCSTAPRR